MTQTASGATPVDLLSRPPHRSELLDRLYDARGPLFHDIASGAVQRELGGVLPFAGVRRRGRPMRGLSDVLDREDTDARHARCDESLPALPAARGRWRQPPAARRGSRTAPLAAAGGAS